MGFIIGLAVVVGLVVAALSLVSFGVNILAAMAIGLITCIITFIAALIYISC